MKETPATLIQISSAARRNVASAAKSWHFFQEYPEIQSLYEISDFLNTVSDYL